MPRLDFLRTRVARRIVTLFVAGALVPVLVMASLSFTAVSRQLERQSRARLEQFAVGAVQMILERLASYRSWVESAGALAAAPPVAGSAHRPARIPVMAPGVEAMALDVDGATSVIAGGERPVPRLDRDGLARIGSGEAVLVLTGRDGPRLHLGVPVRGPLEVEGPAPTSDGGGGAGENGTVGVLWATLRPDSVWASPALLASDPAVADFCVLDALARPLHCKRGADSHLPGLVPPPGEQRGISGEVRFEVDGEEQVVVWRRVYLRSLYGATDWTVAVGEAASSMYQPVESFAYNLPLALAIGLGLVLLLASVLIRKTMEPLEKLAIGTVRIARHDLSARVEVEGRDEFADLASSFNAMAERLALQFRQIEVARAIDRAVISTHDRGAAAAALLSGAARLVSEGRCALLLLDAGPDGPGVLYAAAGGAAPVLPPDGGGRVVAGPQGREPPAPVQTAGRPVLVPEPAPLESMPAEARARPWLRDTAEHVMVEPRDVPPDVQALGLGRAGFPVLLMPLVVGGEVVGAFAIEWSVRKPSPEDLERARQLADQAAVGFHELKLRRDLADMGWEALRALAAAIDAKSRWTAGHSERVTELALALGREMDLGAEDMDTLHRGGLLHDIGKIGVPAEIIDYAGPLDDAMREAMEAHPVIGARILEPVRAFRPILPIVLYHHERWNGGGYPEGLAGTDIPRLARILSVADVFDAMASARPYRTAADMEAVLAYLRRESGASFDPEVVAALDRLTAEGWTYHRPEPRRPFHV